MRRAVKGAVGSAVRSVMGNAIMTGGLLLALSGCGLVCQAGFREPLPSSASSNLTPVSVIVSVADAKLSRRSSLSNLSSMTV